MTRKLFWIILWCVCGALPIVAQTAAVPDGMVPVPAGKFWMGRTQTFFFDTWGGTARDKLDDIPANHVYLDAFAIDKYEVTNADYARFVQATGARAPWHWPAGKIPKGEERFPVANVNWFEAGDYCKWVGKRLPTEAEWEKAARGGLDRNRYAWGDDQVAYTEQGLFLQQATRTTTAPLPAVVGRLSPASVGSLPPNGYGLYDMIGNVMEWTNDWYDSNYYPFMTKTNPPGPETGRYRSVRGAGWSEGGGSGDSKMVHYRNFADPEAHSLTIGFRCAK